ncbi:MAG: hypothetical protein ABI347_03730 [Nitrososphaera sp.]
MKKIQLWSDESAIEFAVCISTEQNVFRASTNPHARYVKLVEEAEYIEGEKYDWTYLLGRWMDSSRSGNWVRTLPLDAPSGPAASSPPRRKTGKKKQQQASSVLTLKCHFCGLTYARKKERDVHEKAWHAAKIEGKDKGLLP